MTIEIYRSLSFYLMKYLSLQDVADFQLEITPADMQTYKVTLSNEQTSQYYRFLHHAATLLKCLWTQVLKEIEAVPPFHSLMLLIESWILNSESDRFAFLSYVRSLTNAKHYKEALRKEFAKEKTEVVDTLPIVYLLKDNTYMEQYIAISIGKTSMTVVRFIGILPREKTSF